MGKKEIVKELFKSRVERLKSQVALWFNRHHGKLTMGLGTALLVFSAWSLFTQGVWQSVEYLVFFAFLFYVRASFKDFENTYHHTVDEFNKSLESIESDLGRIRNELL